jgi:O-antigen/teichoic acid export membrane protein
MDPAVTDAASAARVAVAGVEMTHHAADLDRKLLKGVAWTGVAKVLAQAVSWVTPVFVARLLTPDDYGLVGMAMVYIGITSLVTEFGLGSAIVAIRELSARQIAQLNAVALLLGVLAVAVTAVLADPISQFYQTAAVAPVIVALSGVVLIDSTRSVPTAVLAKGMHFRFLAIVEAVKMLLVAGITIALAFAGMRYWSLVVGVLAGALIPAALILIRCPLPFRIPKPAEIKVALGYTRNFLVTNVAWYACSNADFAIAGRMLGQGPLGEYTFAWTLASSPGEKVVGVVNRVLPSVYAAASADTAALRRYLLRVTESASLIVVPIGVGVALVGADLVALLLGDKWRGAVAPLRILALYGAFHALSTLVPPLLLAVGKVHVLARIVVVSACVLPIAFIVGAMRGGSVGIAAVWVTVYPLIVFAMFRVAFRAIGLSWREYFSALKAAGLSAALMAIAVAVMLRLVAPDQPAVRLGVTVPLGAAVYAASLVGLFRDSARRAITSLRMLRNGAAA